MVIVRKSYVEVTMSELSYLAKVGGERFENHRLIVSEAYGDYFRVRYCDDGAVKFRNRKGGQWHLIGEEANHMRYIAETLNADKGGCKGCKGKTT